MSGCYQVLLGHRRKINKENLLVENGQGKKNIVKIVNIVGGGD